MKEDGSGKVKLTENQGTTLMLLKNGFIIYQIKAYLR